MFDLNHESCGASTYTPELSYDDLRQVVADVLNAMLHCELDDVGDADDAVDVRANRWNACVQLTGAWQGAVVIELSPAFALRAASIIFETPLDAVAAADVNDALAELVNMIGGNIKTLLPGPSLLSLPTVTEGHDFLVKLPGARLVRKAVFQCAAEPIRLHICEKDDVAARH